MDVSFFFFIKCFAYRRVSNNGANWSFNCSKCQISTRAFKINSSLSKQRSILFNEEISLSFVAKESGSENTLSLVRAYVIRYLRRISTIDSFIYQTPGRTGRKNEKDSQAERAASTPTRFLGNSEARIQASYSVSVSSFGRRFVVHVRVAAKLQPERFVLGMFPLERAFNILYPRLA